MNYEEYKERVSGSIRTCKEEMGVQPILFFGSGMSQRYIGTPTWSGLLSILCEECPYIELPLSYYEQQCADNVEVGTHLARYFREWAWKDRGSFPEELFEPKTPADAYIKHYIASYFSKEIVSEKALAKQEAYRDEIELLKKVNPYAIITTNYDQFLESVFPVYEPVIGQEILRNSFASIGEIVKIHGCASRPDSLIFSSEDYLDFNTKKKYLSAKLLTFFAEHPLIIMGYSAQDSNVKAILSDIDEVLSQEDDLVPNIYIVEYDEGAEKTGQHKTEVLVPLSAERSLRVSCIVASDFSWIYEVLGENQAIEGVNPKVLRSILSRTYSMIRCDIPRRKVEVDFKFLEEASSEKGFAKLYGVTNIDDPSTFNAAYPYSLTDVANKLGYRTWHKADQLIKLLVEQTGVNIKSSDNAYHVTIKSGSKAVFNKYSHRAIELLRLVRDGEEYTLEEC
ncbi:hypothetical protein HPA02_02930 [Bisbaumannia pacifica]|uniref:Uncharacterized protein n=1 Tax=Bisbaumannia pacifica TaxID=77098 RepID=A0A510XBU2_9GAMM|nr:SIR2 family protein [Halomonas pacifica]GEK46010.1 hypothetical protein HPA02_02930 [Halomonas pacifica]